MPLYGFHSLQDIRDERISDALVPVVNDAVEQARAFHSAEVDAMTSIFAEPTTSFKERFKTATAARLQPLDEFGRARPIQTRGSFDVAFPIKKAGIAEGNTYEAGVLATPADVEQTTTTIFIADVNWVTDQILASVYGNASWTFSDSLHGDLTILPVANNDAQTYYTTTGANTGSAQNNFLAQAAGIADATNALNTGATQLRKFPGNQGQIISFVPTNLINDVTNLAGFSDTADPNVQLGANTDVVRGGPGVRHPGVLRGYDKVSRTWVVEWDRLVSDYVVQVVATGPRPLGRRQYEDNRLRGLVRLGERNDIPYYERQYARWEGYGGRDRTKMTVTRVGNASYAIPTGYNPAEMA